MAHAGELSRTRKDFKKNAAYGAVNALGVYATPGVGVAIPGNLNGRQFGWTFLGRVVQYEVSDKTLTNLTDIRDRVFAAFAQVGAPPAPAPPRK